MKLFLTLITILVPFSHLQGMNLPHDIWIKIIACSSRQSKENLKNCCTVLHTLSSKNNRDLYMHAPLNLTCKQKSYALSFCTYIECLPAIENLLAHGAYAIDIPCGIATSPASIAQYNKNPFLMNTFGKPNHDKEKKIRSYALAAYMGDLAKIKKYIKSKKYQPIYKTHYKSHKNSTLLYLAIYNGHRDVVTELLTHPKTLEHINSGIELSTTPIAIALMRGHANIAEQLMAISSVKLNNKNCSFQLHYCAQHGYTECVKTLLAHNHNRRTVISLHKDRIYLTGQSSKNLWLETSALTTATSRGYSDIVQHLLCSKDIMINTPVYHRSRDKFYNLTPLFIAAHNGHATIVRLLLQDSSINPLLYMQHYTALHIACKKGYLTIVQLLVEHCPKLLTMKTKKTEESPYQIAYHYNHYEIVKFLLTKNR